MLNKFRSFARSIREHGLVDTVRGKIGRSLRQFTERRFERRYEIDTSGDVALAELGIDGEHCVSYEPSNYKYFHQLMNAARLDSFEGTFIDFGSGKGRAVVLAATYPFRRVIGVEIAEALQATARKNIQRAQPKLTCRNIELVTCDATTYEIPDDAIVIYFFNPFSGPILSNVIQQVHNSYLRSPRKIVIICSMPGRKSSLAKELVRHNWLSKTFECEFANGSHGAIYVAK